LLEDTVRKCSLVPVVIAVLVSTLPAGAAQTPGVPTQGQQAIANRTVPRSECFPDHELPLAEQARSEELLLQMLDSEVLYTFIGGLKPVSCRNIYKLQFIEKWPTTATPEFLAAAEDQRKLMSPWRCGESFGVYVFAHPKRASLCDTYFFHRSALADTLRGQAAYYSALGLTPTSHPIEVIMTADDKDDNKAVGYLFGYPDYAVEWYADVAVPHLEKTKSWPDMDTVEIPTFGKMLFRRTKTEHFRFNWSVPKGHVENEADRRIRTRAAQIFEEYKARRARSIGPGKPGAFALLRDWYCDAQGRCAVENAGSTAPPAVDKDKRSQRPDVASLPRQGQQARPRLLGHRQQ
jgi:hypothetical protein